MPCFQTVCIWKSTGCRRALDTSAQTDGQSMMKQRRVALTRWLQRCVTRPAVHASDLGGTANSAPPFHAASPIAFLSRLRSTSAQLSSISAICTLRISISITQKARRTHRIARSEHLPETGSNALQQEDDYLNLLPARRRLRCRSHQRLHEPGTHAPVSPLLHRHASMHKGKDAATRKDCSARECDCMRSRWSGIAPKAMQVERRRCKLCEVLLPELQQLLPLTVTSRPESVSHKSIDVASCARVLCGVHG